MKTSRSGVDIMATKFSECLEQGAQGETILDNFFRQHYHIRPATQEEQKQGIDRVFKHRKKLYNLTIEYKTDSRAADTRNACLEVAKHLDPYKEGWALTCEADYLIYYVPGIKKGFVIQPEVLRMHLNAWLIAYKLRIVKSEGIYQNYQTQCLIVPLWELENIAVKVVKV